MRSLVSCLLLLSFFIAANGQTRKVKFRVTPFWNGSEVKVDTVSGHTSTDSIVFTTIRCYFSSIEYFRKGRVVFRSSSRGFLWDAATKPEFADEIPLELQFDSLRFCIGIDSLTNVSGVMKGDLDPMQGMYWAWQSGFINIKIEGHRMDSEGKPKEFKYHLGGYLPPYTTLQTITIKASSKEEVTLKLNLHYFFKGLAAGMPDHIMSPGKEAQSLSILFKRSIGIDP